MRGNELLDKLSLADSAYIEAAAIAPRHHTGPRRRWVAVAACAALLAAAGSLLWLRQLPAPVELNHTDNGMQSITTPDIEHSEPATESSIPAWTAHYNTIENMLDASRRYIPGYFQEALDEAELNAVCPEAAQDWITFSGTAGFDGEGELIEVFLWVTTTLSDTSVTVALSQGGISPCFLLPEDAVPSICNGTEYRIGRYVDLSGNISLLAEAQLGSIYCTFSLDTSTALEAQAQADFEAVLECFTTYAAGSPNLSAVTAEEIPQWQDRTLTHPEALADPDFGVWFLPTAPSGFAAESIRRYQNQTTNALWGLWTLGYDQLRWEVRYRTPKDTDNLVDVSRPEMYDLSLYPIPRAESVPEHLWDIVNHPIFDVEDLTLDVLSTRAYTVPDAGDTNSVRMDFSVRYGDIIVEVQSKGVDIHWIYDRLIALQP